MPEPTTPIDITIGFKSGDRVTLLFEAGDKHAAESIAGLRSAMTKTGGKDVVCWGDKATFLVSEIAWILPTHVIRPN